MADITKIEKLKPNQIAGTNPVNKIIDLLTRNFGDGTGLVRQSGYTFPPRIMYIVSAGPNGEADFANEMYWCQTAHVCNPFNNSDGSTTQNLNTDPWFIIPEGTPKSSSAGNGEIIPVMNFAERKNGSSGTHSLPTDGSCAVVVNYFEYDPGGVPRYGMTHFSSGQAFQVSSLPAFNSSSSQIDAWVIANPVSSNGSVGSMNVAIGICIPHAVGDKLHARLVNYNLFGLTYQSSGGGINIGSGTIVSPITLQEIWNGQSSRVGVANGSTGTCNVSSGLFATQQYDVYNDTSSDTKLASNLPVQEHRLWPGAVTAATHGTLALSTSGLWILMRVEEFPGGVNTC